MIRIKLFKDTNIRALEDDVNIWLEQMNGKIQVCNIESSSSRSSNWMTSVVMIEYIKLSVPYIIFSKGLYING